MFSVIISTCLGALTPAPILFIDQRVWSARQFAAAMIYVISVCLVEVLIGNVFLPEESTAEIKRIRFLSWLAFMLAAFLSSILSLAIEGQRRRGRVSGDQKENKK